MRHIRVLCFSSVQNKMTYSQNLTTCSVNLSINISGLKLLSAFSLAIQDRSSQDRAVCRT
jgi:hypothetical protein